MTDHIDKYSGPVPPPLPPPPTGSTPTGTCCDKSERRRISQTRQVLVLTSMEMKRLDEGQAVYHSRSHLIH